jgi:hypothetical protein
MNSNSDGLRQPDRAIAPSKPENPRLREQAVNSLSKPLADQGPSGRVANGAKIFSEQQEELDRLLDPRETIKLFAQSNRVSNGRGDGDRNTNSGVPQEKPANQGVNENDGDKTSKPERPGLNERINKIIDAQPSAKAAENLRSMIFDLYNPIGSAARNNFIQDLRKAGHEAEASALVDKAIAPPFEIGTQGRSPLDGGLTTSRKFSSSNNPRDAVSVFNTPDPNVVGMVTDKNIILLDMKKNEYRQIPLDADRIKSNPADKQGTWSHNLMGAEVSLLQQAQRLQRTDPAAAAKLYQQAFRLSDQQMKNNGVAPDGMEAAREHRHRGSLLSGVGEEKGVDEAKAADEYKLAGKIYEKLNGADHIDTIRNKYDLVAASTKAYGPTESNKKLFEELRQRRIKADPSEQEEDLFDNFMRDHPKTWPALFPSK